MPNPFTALFSPKADAEQQSLLGRLKKHHEPATPSTDEHVAATRTCRTWDVKMPPAKQTMIAGKLVHNPGEMLTGFFRYKTSRIVIEIHSEEETSQNSSSSPLGSALATAFGSHSPQPEKIQKGILRGPSVVHREPKVLHENEVVVMRILRPSPTRGGDDKQQEREDDEGSDDSSVGRYGAEEELEDGKWSEVYRFDLDSVELLKHHDAHADLKLGRGAETMVRQINFLDAKECTSFCEILASLRKLEGEREERELAKFQSTTNEENIHLLVEIVSGVRLPIADISSTDAYVVVYMGKKASDPTNSQHVSSQLAARRETLGIITHTRLILLSKHSINPIWTIHNGSLFLLETTPKEFFGSSSGLTFSIRDYDAVGKNEVLGTVTVKQEELMEGKGDRVEYRLQLGKEFKKYKDARLVLRYRRATPQDLEFMRTYQKKKKIAGAYSEEAYVPARSFRVQLLKRESRKTKSGVREFRVKPEPDPDRQEETTWMTESQIDDEAHKPSKKWIEVGSGAIGKLYFELIGCDGLPNMDIRGIEGKTDAFAAIIFEDMLVNTDVINDTLSPRWLPWTQRAFIFNILHPSSQVLVGIFDFDASAALDDHDPIGRVSINVTNLRPNTDYTMKFDLYTSALVTKRESKGSMTVRIRIEWENERRALLTSAQIPPDIYVNVSREREFHCAKYTTVGMVRPCVFSMDTLTSYIGELWEYEQILYMLKEAVFTVLLWRGTFPVTVWCPSMLQPVDPDHPKHFLRRLFKPVKVKLPLHSLVAFILGILLAENYNFFPSFLLFGIAWALIASMEYQYRNPSPWRRPRRFGELWQVLLFNRTFTDTIGQDENREEIEKFIAEDEALWKEREEEAKKQQEEAEKEAAELQKELEEEAAEEEAIETKTSWGVSVNPLRPFLYPIQLKLGLVATTVRLVRSVVTWEESYAAFWITNACLLAGILLMGVPWDFFIHWAFRITVWILLGPWMKLVDILYVKGRTRKELKEEEAERMRRKYQQLVEARRGRQIRREDTQKLKHMKSYMFGKYLLSVPRFKDSRWIDRPLYPSHASPHIDKTTEYVSASYFGQHLEGHMIPDREANQKTRVEGEASVLLGDKKSNYGSTGKS